MYGEITWPPYLQQSFSAVQILLSNHYRGKRCLPTKAVVLFYFCCKSLKGAMT